MTDTSIVSASEKVGEPAVDKSAPQKTATSKILDHHISPELLGKIVSLIQRSPAHRFLFVADFDWFLAPAIALKQYCLAQQGKTPIALVLWAQVSADVERNLLAGRHRLRPNEWKSGDRRWVIELIAPDLIRNDQALRDILISLSKQQFDGGIIKMRVALAGGKSKIVHFGADEEVVSQ